MGLLLVAYDIPDDRRRDRLAKLLARYGRRVQYSVFLLARGSIEEVRRRVSGVIEPAEDDVRIHPLCSGCEGRAVLLGKAQRPDGGGGGGTGRSWQVV